MISHIFLDMDGVLADFVGGAFPMFNLPEDTILREWDICHHLGIPEDEFWRVIDTGGDEFWENLKMYSWATPLYETCKSLAEVTISTSPSRSPHCVSGKRKWMINKFGPKFKHFMLGSKKYLLARPDRVLIDDNELNVSKFREAGGEGILFPQSWNSLHSIASRNERLAYVTTRLILINERLAKDHNRQTTQSNGSVGREMSALCRGSS